MNDDFDTLKRDYRAVDAPPHLATRIRAEVADRPDRNRAWVPAAVTMSLGIMLAIPFLSQQTGTQPPAQSPTQTQTQSATPTKPSLSALASYTPERPSVPTPNLTQLRSVPVPTLPPRPQLNTQRPQSSLDTEHENLQENDHANA